MFGLTTALIFWFHTTPMPVTLPALFGGEVHSIQCAQQLVTGKIQVIFTEVSTCSFGVDTLGGVLGGKE